MAVSKEQRDDFLLGRRAYSPMQAATLYVKVGVFPRWLDSKPSGYMQRFWKFERLHKYTV